MNRVLCIYHGNCADGFGAAWVVRKYYQERNKEYAEAGMQEQGYDVKFIPGVYQTGLPKDLRKDDVVVIVDFSYKRPDMEKLLSEVSVVTHIDHHKSAIEDLKDLEHPNYNKYFHLDHSGAMLAWMYFFDDKNTPQLLEHIEDRDLWKFALSGTREIQANLFSYPYDFGTWDALMEMKGEALEVFRQSGEAIERKHFKDIRENLNTSVRWMNIGGVVMPVINCPKEWGSDAANILATTSVNLCAAYYWDSADGRNFGLRSVDGGPDVSEICKKYGGGGHMKAAGFTCSPLTSLSFEYEDGKVRNVWNEFRVSECVHNPAPK